MGLAGEALITAPPPPPPLPLLKLPWLWLRLRPEPILTWADEDTSELDDAISQYNSQLFQKLPETETRLYAVQFLYVGLQRSTVYTIV